LHLIVHDFFSHFLAFAGSLISFYFISPYLSLILFCFLIIFFIISYYFSKLLSKMSALSAEERSVSMGAVSDVFSNISNVKIFSSNEKEQGFISKTISRFVLFAQRRQLTFNWVYAFQGVCFSFYQILCLVFLVSGYDRGFITYGDFALVMTVNTTLIRCLWGVAIDLSKFAEYCGNIDQNISSILKTPDILDVEGAKDLHLDKADIEFENVVFKYGGKVIFDNLNLKIKAGQKVGIVGFSGAGKSTFLSILLRLFDINSGSVKIGGVDISKFSQFSLRSNFSVVPQEASLFNRSILENIGYGLDCDKASVIAAAKKAMIHDEIIEMQDGYNFKVGQGGASISGGQRQRIAIARAFLRQSPILVLDEATSALDMFLEKKVKKSIDELMEGKTVIAIAHRLSMLVSMDRILVFDSGKIIEDGSHEELVSIKDGLYAKLWENFNSNS
jgi:ATP-binding cassette, subfamily B, bacterial